MKKIIALSMAVAMVLSLASVALAATTTYYYAIDSVSSDYYKVKSKEVYLNDEGGQSGVLTTGLGKGANKTPSYGNTIYYPLLGYTYDKTDLTTPINPGLVTKADAIKSVKISTTWDMGSEWVSKTELVKKKYGPDNSNYYYFLAITFKSATTKAESSDVIGEIVLKKTSGDNMINRNELTGAKKGETPILPITIELHYDRETADLNITDSSIRFAFGTGTNEIEEDEEAEFTFDKWEDATFTVNTYGQGPIVLKAVTDYNADIGALYPEANLDFYVGNGASFNKTGLMFIASKDGGGYIYEVKNGVLAPIAGAEYDEYEEGFYFKTRTLGVYVISDVELDLAAAPVVTPGDTTGGDITVVEPGAPTVPVNPGTGAAA